MTDLVPAIIHMLLHKTGGSVQEHAFLQLLGIPEGNMAMSQAVDRCFLKVEVYDRFSRSPTFWAKGFLQFMGFLLGPNVLCCLVPLLGSPLATQPSEAKKRVQWRTSSNGSAARP